MPEEFDNNSLNDQSGKEETLPQEPLVQENPPLQREPVEDEWKEQSVPLEKEFANRAKKTKIVKVLIIAAVCVVLFGLAVVGVISIANRGSAASSDSEVLSESGSSSVYEGLALNDKPTGTSVPGDELTTVLAVEKALPSVVTIKVSVAMPAYAAYYGGGMLEGIGSGIIMERDGHIITNAHVVESARSIHVILEGDEEKEFEAELVGIDRRTDLAVIKIDAEGEDLTLVPAVMGNSDQVKVGEKILIMGTPQDIDLAGSVTQGIISGLNRELTAGTTQYTGLLQVDAAINPGNSGGALVNGDGQVIGINSAKYIDIGAEGLGFSISINSAKPILDELMNKGRIESRYCLGFTAHEVDEETARIDRVPVGLYVDSLRSGSDMQYKVMVGDIITHVDGKPSPTIASVKEALEDKKAGDSVKLKLNRYNTTTNENEDIEVTVTLMQDVDEKSEYEMLMEFYDKYGSEDESSSSIPQLPPESGQLASFAL